MLRRQAAEVTGTSAKNRPQTVTSKANAHAAGVACVKFWEMTHPLNLHPTALVLQSLDHPSLQNTSFGLGHVDQTRAHVGPVDFDQCSELTHFMTESCAWLTADGK